MCKVPTFVVVVIVVVVKLVEPFPTGKRMFQESFFKWSAYEGVLEGVLPSE